MQVAGSRRLDIIPDQLEFSAALVQRYLGFQSDLISLFGAIPEKLIAALEKSAAHLRTIVFEREIPMARAGAGEIGDFADDPDNVEMALE